jgi:hypothetical protein
MSELEFQKALVKILTDSEMRRNVSDAATHLASLNELSWENAARITQIDQSRLECFALAIEEKRHSEIKHFLPITAKLLDWRLPQLLRAFNHQYRPQFIKVEDFALSFAAYLETQCGQDKMQSGYLRDVLSYEWAIVDLFSKAEIDPQTKNESAFSPITRFGDAAELVPRRSSNYRIVPTDYDIPAICQIVADGGEPPDPVKSPRIILLYINDNGSLSHDSINEATRTFIEECDGILTLGEIVRRLSVKYAPHKPELNPRRLNNCAALFELLNNRGVLTYSLINPDGL